MRGCALARNQSLLRLASRGQPSLAQWSWITLPNHLRMQHKHSLYPCFFHPPTRSPKDNPKFDAMGEALYPDLHRNCHGFMRHKVLTGSSCESGSGGPQIGEWQRRRAGAACATAAVHAGSSARTATPHVPAAASPKRSLCWLASSSCLPPFLVQDIMISPKMLKTHNVPYMMAKQVRWGLRCREGLLDDCLLYLFRVSAAAARPLLWRRG